MSVDPHKIFLSDIDPIQSSLDGLSLTQRCRDAILAFRDDAEKRYGSEIVRMILYGSAARGDMTEDIDILVVWKGDRMGALDHLSEISYEVSMQYGELI